MSRYVTDVKTSKSTGEVEQTVSEYLLREGFKKATYKSEEVWKKGQGLLIGQQFIKATPTDGQVHIEAWCQYAILPGVGVGEMGTEGTFNAAAKRNLKKRTVQLEQLLS